MYIKLFTFLICITAVITLPIEVIAVNDPSVTILSHTANQVYKKGEPAIAKIKIDNIPKSGVTLWLRDSAYSTEHKQIVNNIVAPDYYFKKSKSVVATIPFRTEFAFPNTDIHLFARIWKGYHDVSSGNRTDLASDWSDSTYRVVDERSKVLPDYYLEKFEYINPEKLKPGKTAKVKLTIGNIGVADTNQLLEIVSYTDRRLYTSKQKSFKVAPPKVGESRTYIISGKVDLDSSRSDGSLGMNIELDPNNFIPELIDFNFDDIKVRDKSGETNVSTYLKKI